MADRRQRLLDLATDHVLDHGLIGLTLRPLAAAIGTSDRMLIYHFGSRDALVSALVANAGARAVAEIDRLPGARTVRSAVIRLWEVYQTEPMRGLMLIYIHAAATGLIGREPFLTEVRRSNQEWFQALCRYLIRSGAPERRVARIVTLVDSALYGFHLDLITDRPDELGRGVRDLAEAAQRLAP